MARAKIVCEPPGPEAKKIIEKYNKSVSPVVYHIQPNLVVKSAEGSLITDVDGNMYIDFLSGVGVTGIGHRHPKVEAAIKEQLNKYTHVNPHVPRVPIYMEYGEKIQSIAPEGLKDGKIFLGNSGTEGVEAALKLARYHTKKPIIIGYDPSFHGRTLGALSITTGAKGRKYLESILGSVKHVKYPYCYRCPKSLEYPGCGIACMEELTNVSKLLTSTENIAGVIMEPIAGEPGVLVPPKEYLKELRKFCDENNLLLIADEVQTGLGKTGKMWAVEHSGVTPDIMVYGKAAGGGLPLGGIIAKKEIADKWEPGHHASTFGGNPLSCAAGIATIDVILKENLVERSAKTGEYILKRLKEFDYDLIGDIRGKGTLIGIELVKDKKTKQPASEEAAKIKERAFKYGLIASVAGKQSNVIRLSPALNIEQELVDEGLNILEKAFREVCR